MMKPSDHLRLTSRLLAQAGCGRLYFVSPPQVWSYFTLLQPARISPCNLLITYDRVRKNDNSIIVKTLMPDIFLSYYAENIMDRVGQNYHIKTVPSPVVPRSSVKVCLELYLSLVWSLELTDGLCFYLPMMRFYTNIMVMGRVVCKHCRLTEADILKIICSNAVILLKI